MVFSSINLKIKEIEKYKDLKLASGGRVVAGSNPVTPTDKNQGVKSLRLDSFLFSCILENEYRISVIFVGKIVLKF